MITKENIIKLMKEVNPSFNAEDFHPDISMREQGIDSLDITSLLFEIEEKYGVNMSDKDESEFETIDLIIKYINEN